MIIKFKLGEVCEELTTETDTLISVLKTTVEKRTGIPSSSQKWIYQGRIISNDSTVEGSGIGEGHVVHVVKTAQPSQNSNPSSTSPTNPSVASQITQPTQITQPIQQRLSPEIQYGQQIIVFDNAMKKLLLNPEADAKTAVLTLSKIVKNIIDHPLEAKYRQLKTSNAALQKKLFAISGGSECLTALGFMLDNGEWVLVPSPQAWDVLLMCKDKLERFSSRLLSLSLSLSLDGRGERDPSPAGSPSAPSPSLPLPAPVTSPILNQETQAALQQMMSALMTMPGVSGASDAAGSPSETNNSSSSSATNNTALPPTPPDNDMS